MSRDLERRYRQALRLLPGWYREQWEEDMVAAFLDSWLTGGTRQPPGARQRSAMTT